MDKDEFYIWDFVQMTDSEGISNRKNNHRHLSKIVPNSSLFFQASKNET